MTAETIRVFGTTHALKDVVMLGHFFKRNVREDHAQNQVPVKGAREKHQHHIVRPGEKSKLP